MYAGYSWRQFEGQILDGRVRVGPLIGGGNEAMFSGEWVGIAGPEITVRLTNASPEPVLERYLEASFFDHPNLLGCFGAGEIGGPGGRVVYAILARFDERLSDILTGGPLSPDAALEMGRQIASGLAYLHRQNIVHCNLDPFTVVRTAGAWKLADYSELRVAGRGYGAETRRLVAARASTPPEAYEGVVLPAWDSWSLAILLSSAVLGVRRDGSERASSRKELPEPFQTITVECLSRDPDARSGVDRIRELLEGRAVQPELVQPARVAAVIPAAVPGGRRPVRYLVPDVDADPPADATPPPVPHPVSASGWKRPALMVIGAVLGFVAVLAFLLARSPGVATPRPEAVKPAPPVTVPETKPKPSPAAPADRGESDRVAAKPAPAEAAIRDVIDRWVETSRNKNAAGQAALYAPRVQRFYGAQNVTRDWVRRYRASAFRRSGPVRRFDLDNVQLNVTGPDAASAIFDKSWLFGGRSPYSGKVRSQLVFNKIEDQWLITSERDLHVYSTRSGQ